MSVRGAAGRTLAGVGAAVLGRAVAYRVAPLDLQGRVVVITGSSRGLGLALAREFAGHGAKVALGARTAEDLETAAADLRADGTEVFTQPCDVRDADAVKRFVDVAAERFGTVDVMVNNAGVITLTPAQGATLDDYRESMDIMFYGTLHGVLAALPHLRAPGSGRRIVNVTSIGGKVALPQASPYTAAKFAATGLSEGLRAELAREGIKVTTVTPGFMRTGSTWNIQVRGYPPAAFGLATLAATLPLVTSSAEHAARRIVAACRRGEPDVTITPVAQLAALAHGVAPGLTADLLGVVNRLLPIADSNAPKVLGRELSEQTPISQTPLGARAEARLQPKHEQ